jgi:hypothetical protein
LRDDKTIENQETNKNIESITTLNNKSENLAELSEQKIQTNLLLNLSNLDYIIKSLVDFLKN